MVEGQGQVEDPAGIDLAVPDEIDELGQEAAHRGGTAVQVDLREEQLVVRELDVVREARKGRTVMTNGPFLDVSLDGAGPGDEVLVPSPYWVTFPEAVALAGGVPVPVPTDGSTGFRVGVDQLEESRTKRTKALLFVSPSNPTGALYSEPEVEALGRWAAETGLWVVTDEMYERLEVPGAHTALGLAPGFGPDYLDGSAFGRPLFGSGAIGPDACCNSSLVGADAKKLKKWGYEVTKVPSVDEEIADCEYQAVPGTDQQVLVAAEPMGFGRIAERRREKEIARQRLEYILLKDPSFPGAQEKLTEVLVQISLREGIQSPTPTPVPTTTPDFTGAEQAYSRAAQLISAQDWPGALNALDELRKLDVSYQSSQVDGMYYFALRNYGYTLITQKGNLEGGIYQLALAERFGPLDRDSNGLREGARVYLIGASFWELDWAQALFYFEQARAWGNLWDGTMTATERYYYASMRYGDQLFAEGKYCEEGEAIFQYQNAMTVGALDKTAQSNYDELYLVCFPPTPTIDLTALVTPTTPVVGTTTVPDVPTNTPEPPTETPTETPTGTNP